MIPVNEIGWGRYKNYSGPFYKGQTHYSIPENPDFLDKTLAVFTATEGGRFEALNMYDRCIFSLGLIQFCGAAPIFGADNLLGAYAEKDKNKLDSFIGEMPAKPEFKRINREWRFDNNGIVDSKEKQRDLFLGSSGAVDGWNEETKLYAKQNAVALASISAYPDFQQVQVNYIKPRLLTYVMKNGKEIIFRRADTNGWWGALKAAYVSFAGNLPSVANDWIKKATELPEWSGASDKDKCILALKTLTFGPGITIWPHRYNVIRKTLEKLFGIDLPDLAEDLKKWEDSTQHRHFRTTEELQAALDFLGYELGPAGVDGKFGTKTSEALREFETDNGLPADGIIDPISSQKLYEALQDVTSNSMMGRFLDLSDAVMRGETDDIEKILSMINSNG